MRKRFVLLLLLGLMSFLAVCHAQNTTVSYSYDACGNRVERTLKFGIVRNGERSEAYDEGEDWLTMAEDSLGGVSLSLFPNPTDSKFTLSFSTETLPAVKAELFTAGGAVIEVRKVKSTAEEFDLTGKPAGMYLLRLMAGRDTQTWKIIKKD